MTDETTVVNSATGQMIYIPPSPVEVPIYDVVAGKMAELEPGNSSGTGQRYHLVSARADPSVSGWQRPHFPPTVNAMPV